MPQFLMIVGAILVLVGMGSIAAGAPDWVLGLSLGATLIQSGAIALVGGLILIALGMVLSVLQDLMKRLEVLAPAGTARAAAAPEERPAIPAPRPPAAEPLRSRETAPVSAGDEFPRPPREALHGAEPPRPRRERPREPMPEEGARVRRPGPSAPPGEEQQRRELPPPPSEEVPARPRAARTLDQASEDIARMRSEYAAGRREEPPRPRREAGPIRPLPQPFARDERAQPFEPASESPEPYVPKFRPAETAPAPAPAPATAPARAAAADTVVRSGVIGGMAYTLYADGSIEAELGIGTVRFDSIADLQDHVTRTGAEADGDFDESSR
jgi:predicted lipid-binding transport protein (Tim44 family)